MPGAHALHRAGRCIAQRLGWASAACRKAPERLGLALLECPTSSLPARRRVAAGAAPGAAGATGGGAATSSTGAKAQCPTPHRVPVHNKVRRVGLRRATRPNGGDRESSACSAFQRSPAMKDTSALSSSGAQSAHCPSRWHAAQALLGMAHQGSMPRLSWASQAGA